MVRDPLNLYYSDARKDNFTTTKQEGRAAALAAGPHRLWPRRRSRDEC